MRFQASKEKIYMNFQELGLGPEIVQSVSDAGYTEATPIQEKAIPYVLMGRDVLGVAQTGTGKTASFTLPMIDILSTGRAKARMPRSLILEPTRELAHQVSESFDKYGKYSKLSMALLIGGESFKDQQAALERGVDVLIATPGRLLDLFERGHILLADTKLLVIDEADRMLDMGFMPDVERIVSLLPKIRQTLFFSATMAPEIRRLADAFLMNPKEVSVAPPASTAATVSQSIVRSQREPKAKRAVLRDLLRREEDEMQSALIFCNRKRDVGVVHKSLLRHGFDVAALHGDMAQPARMATLAGFKQGDVKVLVCSDVAARGLDIPQVSHVFNFDVPVNSEDYVHRIGRTGRAGRSGKAFTIATKEDSKLLASLYRLIGREVEELRMDGAVDGAVDGGAVEEAAPAPTEKRRARGSRKPKQDQVCDDAKPAANDAAAAEEKTARRRGKAKAADRADPTPANGNMPDSPFGDHTPAFMLRPVPMAANA